MKQLKRALLSTAVLAGLYAGNAMAGTEACFEVLKATDDASATSVLARWATVYQKAGCEVGPGAADQQLAGFDPISVAYELTGNLELDFDDVDGNATADDLALPFYIPTTDLPGGSRIQVSIDGARFANNGNQLHLIQATYDETTGTYSFESVASSDGAVDRTGSVVAGFAGGQVVTFVTKAANTVGAGSRLFISRTSVNADIPMNVDNNGTPADFTDDIILGQAVGTEYQALQPLNIGINNEGCPDTPDVLLRATSAVTDGGSPILGGVSSEGVDNSVLTLVSAAPQFALFTTGTQSGATSAEVNAEVPSLRTEFVANWDAGATEWVPEKVRPDFVWYTMGATDIGGTLDRSLTLDPLDTVRIHAAATNGTGATVVFDAFNTTNSGAFTVTDLAVLPDDVFNVGALAGIDMAWATLPNTVATLNTIPVLEAADPASVAGYHLDANEVFTAAADDIQFTLQNTADGVMNFNYDVNVRYGIEFVDANYIDLAPTCNGPVNTHEIGVNGAVLKVPYTVDATGNFVRISNEHTSDALVTFDIFGEDPALASAGKEVVNVELGTLPPKSSVVYLVSDLVELAKAQGFTEYVGDTVTNGLATNGKRHFITFTVTAPKNKVHGVSVQKITNGVDRVIPVLDQNDWNQ